MFTKIDANTIMSTETVDTQIDLRVIKYRIAEALTAKRDFNAQINADIAALRAKLDAAVSLGINTDKIEAAPPLEAIGG